MRTRDDDTMQYKEDTPSLPSGRWIVSQSLHDVLFAHWPLPEDALRERIPEPLQLDTFEGSAWIGIVAFLMKGARFRASPALPGLSAFAQLNVRTYVTAGDRPGVWFLSLDAGSRLAALGARYMFHLPYHYASTARTEEAGWIRHHSRRAARGAASAEFIGRYRPTGDPFEPRHGTPAHFLTERYSFYATRRNGSLLRGEICHAPWVLQNAQAEIETNTMTLPLHLELPDVKPLLHYSRRGDLRVWNLRSARCS